MASLIKGMKQSCKISFAIEKLKKKRKMLIRKDEESDVADE